MRETTSRPARLTRLGCAVGVLTTLAVAGPVTPSPVGRAARIATLDATAGMQRAPFTFRLVGVSWDRAADARPAWIRTKGSQRWTAWRELEPATADGPDIGAREPLARSTTPLWVGRADEVEVRDAGRARIVVVDPGDDPPRLRSAAADPSRPSVITRAEWGADESIRRKDPDYAPRVVHSFVHHTATSNDYSPADSAGLVRAIYQYHVQTNGWDDIGYNALIDQYGQIFEGRYGGLDRAVVGAHAMGFNTGSTGVAILGTFSGVDPPTPAVDSLQRFLAWRLDVDRLDPAGFVNVTSKGSDVYPEGTVITLPTIAGHRDTRQTDCPGDVLYARLPALRETVNSIGAPKLFNPRASLGTIKPGGEPADDVVRFSAGFSHKIAWRLDMTDAAGRAVRRATGHGTALGVSWDGRDDADVPQPAGTYTARIVASNEMGPVRSWTATVKLEGTPSSPPSVQPGAGGSYTPLEPQRVLDTRHGIGAAGPDQTITLPLAGRAGVPQTGAVAVTMNVTVTNPTAASWLTVHPADQPRPHASNLNFVSGQTVAQLVTVRLSQDGAVRIFNHDGEAHVIADIAGWYGERPDGAGRLRALEPSRIVDTRHGLGAASTRLEPGQTIEVAVAGRGGVPSGGAEAAVLNVTVTNATATSYLTLHPSDQARPVASNVNFVGGQTVANRASVKLGPSGTVKVHNEAGYVDLVLDVNAWFGGSTQDPPASGQLRAATPVRVLDTRTGTGGYAGPVGADDRMDVQIAGRTGVPATGASAVVLSVTATNPTDWSYLTVSPSGEELPVASDVNFAPWTSVPNLVVVKLGQEGRISVYNAVGEADVIFDVAGWYAS